MSHAPSSSDDPVDRYLAGWRATTKLLRQGRSLSGHERNCVFLNCGPATAFANISAVSGLDFPDDGRALATVDWDHDGDLDIWLRNRNGPRLRLMRNETRTSMRAPKADYVALFLRGVTCNRDAIGARVEIRLRDRSSQRLIQTMYAGDGFIGQSSKWLHFGLGTSTSIDHVVVHWPGGAIESFAGVSPNGHYVLQQGRGTAIRWRRPESAGSVLKLAASQQVAHESTQVERVLLPSRLPMPVLRQKTFDGATEMVRHAEPLLIHFWASWCLPCLDELRFITRHASQLRNTGIDILALSVDGFDEEKRTSPSDAKRFLDQIEFPFRTGLATSELLDKIQILQDILFNRQPTFEVPLSFLVDRDGQLVAIYRGRLNMDGLLGDLSNLTVSPEQLRALAVPFSGRWHAKIAGVNLPVLAAKFQDRFPDDAIRFLESALESGGPSVSTELAMTPIEHTDVRRRLAAILRDHGRLDEAIAHLRQALETHVDDADAHYDLANALRSQGKLDQAIRHYQVALQLNPQFAEAHNNLANAFHAQGRLDLAASHYRDALRLRDDFGEAAHNWAVVLTMMGKLKQALEQFYEAMRQRPDWPAPMNGAALILATHPDTDVRDAKQAIRLAERASELTDHGNAGIINTLAAAYAASGDFERAVQTALDARQMAQTAKNLPLADEIERRLKLFRQSMPYRAPR